MTDYVTLWRKYQREEIPQKTLIERFCALNGFTYKQFNQWHKTDRNISFMPLELEIVSFLQKLRLQVRFNIQVFKSIVFA